MNSEEPDTILYKKWLASQKHESILKSMFLAKRKRGEWFALNEEDLKLFDKSMEKFYCTKEEAVIGLTSKLLDSIYKNESIHKKSKTNA